jgi:hypothetical protein
MLYTTTNPAEAYDRIRLFPSLEAARAVAFDGRHVQIVAVDYDHRMRRVVPLAADPALLDPAWSAPAQFHPDGSVTAKGPLPSHLFVA